MIINDNYCLDDKNLEFREIRNLEKMDVNYVSEIVTAWVERDVDVGVTYIYILMEYIEDDLQKILVQAPSVFNNHHDNTIDWLEFRFSLELFKELVETVLYMHSYEKSYKMSRLTTSLTANLKANLRAS